MDKYEIDFSYVEPMFGSIDGILADDAEEAEQLGLQEIKQAYPEAQDITIEMVKKIN